LRLVTDLYLGPSEALADDNAPGVAVEVFRQVFAPLARRIYRGLPPNRVWRMLLRGKRDGMFTTLRTAERERVCSLPEEPMDQGR
jgi:hypothetical protein